jgi:hypothetical protein
MVGYFAPSIDAVPKLRNPEMRRVPDRHCLRQKTLDKIIPDMVGCIAFRIQVW